MRIIVLRAFDNNWLQVVCNISKLQKKTSQQFPIKKKLIQNLCLQKERLLILNS